MMNHLCFEFKIVAAVEWYDIVLLLSPNYSGWLFPKIFTAKKIIIKTYNSQLSHNMQWNTLDLWIYAGLICLRGTFYLSPFVFILKKWVKVFAWLKLKCCGFVNHDYNQSNLRHFCADWDWFLCWVMASKHFLLHVRHCVGISIKLLSALEMNLKYHHIFMLPK